MTCSRCSSPLLNQIQFDRGLCGMCLTGSSLSALVGLAASHPPTFEYEVDTLPDHLIRQCIHGTVISQCRCASKSKHVIVDPICPTRCTGTTSAPQPEDRTAIATPIQPPVCFVPRADFEGLPKSWPSDTAWKADVFGDGAIQ